MSRLRESPHEGQAEALSKRLGIAYPMLYMAHVPPDEPIKVPDLRTFDGRPLTNPSPALLDVLDSTRARQNWYREEAKEIGGESLAFVGKFSASDSVAKIVFDMRSTFDIGASIKRGSSDYESFLKTLVAKAEDLGILVMRSAVVGHATRRKLNTKEFRGFALPDPLAPVVFINDNDAKAAQIFTLAHELAHVWLGASGISDRPPDEKGASANPIDIKCDHSAEKEGAKPEVREPTRRNRGTSGILLKYAMVASLMPQSLLLLKNRGLHTQKLEIYLGLIQSQRKIGAQMTRHWLDASSLIWCDRELFKLAMIHKY